MVSISSSIVETFILADAFPADAGVEVDGVYIIGWSRDSLANLRFFNGVTKSVMKDLSLRNSSFSDMQRHFNRQIFLQD